MKERKNRQAEPFSGLSENPRKARHSALVKRFALADGKINVGKCKFVLARRRSAYYICRTKSPFVQGKADAVFIWIPPVFFCQRRNYFFVATAPLGRKQACHGWMGATQHFSGSLHAGIEKQIISKEHLMTTPTNEQLATPSPAGGEDQGKFFGHPRQLGTLFHIELWERFSFYGMQAILLIYLYYEVSKGGLGMDETKAAGIVGAYNGSIYLATILSGWLSDRILGAEKTLFLSGVVVMLGHIVLSALPNMSGLVIGLLLIFPKQMLLSLRRKQSVFHLQSRYGLHSNMC